MRLELYLITDPVLAGDRPLSRIVASALAGGVTAVQLRDKRATPRQALEMGSAIQALARRHRAHFIVNDRVDLAMALDADGVHVGPEDLPPLEARRLMAPPRLLGVSAGTLHEALAAQATGADYLGVGPVFSTSTKPDAGEPLGLETLARIAAAVRIPVVGIGGIDGGNAGGVVEAGAAGVAVISALVQSTDPEATARKIRSEVDRALRTRAGKKPPGEASK